MLPAEAYMPKFLACLGQMASTSPKTQVIGDLCLMAFYFSWQFGEYIIKGLQKYSKQTEQFKIEDCLFSGKMDWDNYGNSHSSILLQTKYYSWMVSP